ncbi:MAG: hypothetical protein MR332_13120 [Fusicatenibacter sp.]|nr:hypothetical protein [Fusicatenibacter sp.]
MNAELFEYDITPKILPSGLEQRVAIRPISPNREFDENTIYTIRVFPMTEVSTLVSTFEV